jgi:hypothetical protein
MTNDFVHIGSWMAENLNVSLPSNATQDPDDIVLQSYSEIIGTDMHNPATILERYVPTKDEKSRNSASYDAAAMKESDGESKRGVLYPSSTRATTGTIAGMNGSDISRTGIVGDCRLCIDVHISYFEGKAIRLDRGSFGWICLVSMRFCTLKPYEAALFFCGGICEDRNKLWCRLTMTAVMVACNLTFSRRRVLLTSS